MSAQAFLEEDLWKVKDVAKYLRVSTSNVYKMVEAGKLEVVRVGALLRFRPSRVRAWVEAGGSKDKARS